MSLSTKIALGALGLLLFIILAMGVGFRSLAQYDQQHPQTCISKQKLVNQSASTLTFANGQVMDESQLRDNSDLKIGNVYCVAYARQ